jgi:hypothetical protein
MTHTRLATVGDVIAALSTHDPATPIRLATQPGYPMHHLLAQVVRTPDDADGDGTPPTDPPVVWLGEGEQIGHLSPGGRRRPRVDTVTTTVPTLAERAVHAARVHRAADPDGFHHRHDTPEQWNRWARRARVAHTLATALNLPTGAVLVTDDPHRTYPTRSGEVPGDLITATDPATGTRWRFIPDHTTPGQAWLLLAACPDCATDVPVARIATLADLGAHLDPDDTAVPVEPRDRTRHTPGCPHTHPTGSR